MKQRRIITAVALLVVLSVAPVFAQCAGTQEQEVPLVYSNAAAGVSVTAPDGWIMYQGMRKHPATLVVFSRLPYEAQESDNPRIILIREKARKKGPDSAITKAFRDAEVISLMRNLKNIAAAVLLEGPAYDQDRGFARLSYEVTERKKASCDTVRSCEYVFMKKGVFFTLLCGAKPEVFDKYRDLFERTAKSLILN
jgi:hypothetical protein